MKRLFSFVGVLACAFSLAGQEASSLEEVQQTKGEPLAVQLWSLRSMGGLVERLVSVREAGISAVEIEGTYGLSAGALKSLLDSYGMWVVGMHVEWNELRTNLDGLIAFSEGIGNRAIVLPWLGWDELPTDSSGWFTLGQKLGKLAEQAQSAGMTLVYHNHAVEMQEFEGKTALELLFEGAGSALKAEIDVAWVARGGKSPVTMLERFSGRMYSIHAKDNALEGQGEAEGGFADVGSGVLDWDAILPAAMKAGVKWYIIEHDEPRDPAASVKASAEYLRSRLRDH